MQNLDADLNELSYKIFEKLEKVDKKYQNLCDKALGVLANDGPYAFVLFITSKKADEYYLKPIWKNEKLKNLFNLNGNYKQDIQSLSENLHKYLFFKTILEKLLIYVRYHLKTLDDKNSDNDKKNYF